MSIKRHEGRKYLRMIHSAVDLNTAIEVDVYSVLEAFNVKCPATAHAVKKLLCAGIRGKGDVLSDLYGAKAAIERAIELHDNRCGDMVVPDGFDCAVIEAFSDSSEPIEVFTSVEASRPKDIRRYRNCVEYGDGIRTFNEACREFQRVWGEDDFLESCYQACELSNLRDSKGNPLFVFEDLVALRLGTRNWNSLDVVESMRSTLSVCRYIFWHESFGRQGIDEDMIREIFSARQMGLGRS